MYYLYHFLMQWYLHLNYPTYPSLILFSSILFYSLLFSSLPRGCQWCTSLAARPDFSMRCSARLGTSIAFGGYFRRSFHQHIIFFLKIILLSNHFLFYFLKLLQASFFILRFSKPPCPGYSYSCPWYSYSCPGYPCPGYSYPCPGYSYPCPWYSPSTLF